MRNPSARSQLVRQVLRLDGHLAGHIHRKRIRAVLVDDRPQPCCGLGDRAVHVDRLGGVTTVGAQVCRFHPARCGEQVGRRRALGAQPAEVGRMFFVANRLRDVTAVALRYRCDLQHHAATDAAVGTQGVHDVCRRHGVPGLSGHACRPSLDCAMALTPHAANSRCECTPNSLCGRHVSAPRPEISAALGLPLNGRGAAVKSPGNPAAADHVIAGHRRPAAFRQATGGAP